MSRCGSACLGALLQDGPVLGWLSLGGGGASAFYPPLRGTLAPHDLFDPFRDCCPFWVPCLAWDVAPPAVIHAGGY
jgi:hypothetical protein